MSAIETPVDNPLVELINVSVGGMNTSSRAVRVADVNWQIRAGDYWVVGALAGSGKSDVFTTAAGIQRPLDGFHILFGRDIRNLNEAELVRERLRIGIVFEEGGRLFNHLTVEENLALPICYHHNCPPRAARDQVMQVLEMTGLADYADVKPTRIARNLHQRIGLARALALQPELLLIDNPLTGTDPRQTYWWLDFLNKLSEGHPALDGRKTTLAVTTNDLRSWTDRGRQFAFINKNRWEVVGPREGVLKSRDPVVRELLAEEFIDF